MPTDRSPTMRGAVSPQVAPALSGLTAGELAERLEERTATSTAIVTACLSRIAEREPAVLAWQYLDAKWATEQAGRRDAAPRRGPLHGIPVGIKDLIDTAELPTEYGSRLYVGHRPAEDAQCVRRLLDAGGIVLGKTVTTEFAASYEAARTRNPLDPARTPGGSSSGSAAAVADRMVPLAIGTQTGGSVLRPASFCGVFGFKPTFGAIGRTGVKPVSHSLDTVGIFARTVGDLSLLANVLFGRDAADSATHGPRPNLSGTDIPAAAPRIAYIRTPWWREADADMRAALDRAAQILASSGAHVDELTLPAIFDGLVDAAALVMDVEGAQALGPDYDRAPEGFDRGAAKLVAAGRARGDGEYRDALDLGARCRGVLRVTLEPFDVALLPVAKGEAPTFETTGDPLFCRPWTMLGNPAVSVPGMRGSTGLPLGVQVLGKPARDVELLRAAEWIAQRIAPAGR